jgi:hypothetical protein
VDDQAIPAKTMAPAPNGRSKQRFLKLLNVFNDLTLLTALSSSQVAFLTERAVPAILCQQAVYHSADWPKGGKSLSFQEISEACFS